MILSAPGAQFYFHFLIRPLGSSLSAPILGDVFAAAATALASVFLPCSPQSILTCPRLCLWYVELPYGGPHRI